jgi:porin
VGLWGYTEPQADIRQTAPDGSPERRRSQGVYLLAEGPLRTWASGAELSGFLRAGRGDGDTSPYDGGWQAGLRLEHFVPGRPKAAFSAGVQQGFLSRKQRDNGMDEGRDIGPAESGVELVYGDSIGRVSIRPDLQLIFHPEGDRARDTAVVGALRLTIDLN